MSDPARKARTAELVAQALVTQAQVTDADGRAELTADEAQRLILQHPAIDELVARGLVVELTASPAYAAEAGRAQVRPLLRNIAGRQPTPEVGSPAGADVAAAATSLRLCSLGVAICLVFLSTGCARMNDPAPEVPYGELADAKPALLDARRQLYRFGDGVCRELGRIPPPWSLRDAAEFERRDPTGYSWRGGKSIAYEHIVLWAENAAFGVPPPNTLPSKYDRSGGRQELIYVYLGAPQFQLAGAAEISIAKAMDPSSHEYRWPQKTRYPIGKGYSSYAYSEQYSGPDVRVAIVNPAHRAGVVCDAGFPDSPNAYCQGVVFLGGDEGAMFEVSYEALSKLDEIVASIHQVARTIRVDCPQGE